MLHYSKPIIRNNPFLSIITRRYKRPVGLARNRESVLDQTDMDLEQIYITDNAGMGLLSANKSFGNPEVKMLIEGNYVYLLDDDDYITNPDMVKELKLIVLQHNPDVIFFRMIIKNNMNGNYYPTAICWKDRPMIAHIGGSCFVVKREIYMKFIHEFAKPRCGDFYFIDAVFRSGAKCYWHDVLMAETGKVSRGQPENV
jgi:hypothetical protein